MVVIITEIISLMYYAILCIFAGELTNVTQTFSVLLGFLLITMSYISFGGFMSSLTENQIIAGIATIILLLATWFLPNISNIFKVLSPIELFQKFPQGVISISNTVTLLSQTLLFTLLTITVLQRKKNIR